MWSFWRSRDRFSLDELKYLNEQLQRTTIVNDSNKDFVVETLRSMAELLIWGDQHDPSFFEFFMEKQVMAHFIYILKNSSSSNVMIQLLQTLNIMVQSIRSEQAIYYLFSNEYINNLITYPFDFENEELVAYFISFLRTISTKLDRNTISFFVKTKNDVVMEFPLYSEAIKFAHHQESMVRIAVRTLTLHIYNIDDEAIRKFIMNRQSVGYFLELVTSLRHQTAKLVDLVTEAAKNPESVPTVAKLEEAIAETGDLLFYCNDIINAGFSDLSRLMSQHILELLVIPVLIPSLRPYQATEMQTKELSSMYLLSCLFQVVKQKELVNGIGLELLRKSLPMDEGSDSTERISYNGTDDRLIFQSSRELLLSYLFCENDKLVLASLNVLIAMLQNEVLNEALLDALGILPQRKRYKNLLLQALVGNNRDEEVLFSPISTNEGDDKLDLHSMRPSSVQVSRQELKEDNSGFENLNKKPSIAYPESSHEPAFGSESEHISPRRNRYQVLDSLMRLFCRRPPPCAEALWHSGWLLRQLLPYHEQKLRDHHLLMLNKAYAAAQDDLMEEIRDCWCDLLSTLLIEEWKVCKKATETSVLKKDTSFVILPNARPAFSTGDVSSSFVGERMQASVKVFVILHQLRTFVLEGSVPEVPPLKQAREHAERHSMGLSGTQIVSIKRDTEVDLSEAIPCRIAFEKGKERSVHLLVFLEGTAGWLILAEDLPLRPKRGIIRVIAALAGSNPRIDDNHPKWLHLRIRSPHPPASDAGKIGGVGGRGPRSKRLVDGRWTLAFPDEKTCKHAETTILKEMDIQRCVVRHVLEPLMDSSLGRKDDIDRSNS